MISACKYRTPASIDIFMTPLELQTAVKRTKSNVADWVVVDGRIFGGKDKKSVKVWSFFVSFLDLGRGDRCDVVMLKLDISNGVGECRIL